MASQPLWTVWDLARDVGVAPEVIRRHLRAGRLTGIKLGTTWGFTAKLYDRAVQHYRRKDEATADVDG